MAEVRAVGANSNAVSKSARWQSRAQALIDDFDQRCHILDIVSRYAAADCENAKTPGGSNQFHQLFAIDFEVDEERLLAAPFSLDVVDIEVVTELRVDKRRDKDRHAVEVGGLQDAALVGIILCKMFPHESVQQRRANGARTIELLDDLADHLFDGIEIGFGLKRIGNPIEFAARQGSIVVSRIVFVVLQSDG